jgi:hypothetical protein
VEFTSMTGSKRNIRIGSLVKQSDPQASPLAVCRLVDRQDGQEYLVVDNVLGRALADYLEEEVEVLGTVQERDGDRLISIRDFTLADDQGLDMEEYLPARPGSGHRWGGASRDDFGRSRNRSQTKALQTARRQKQDRQNWEAQDSWSKE